MWKIPETYSKNSKSEVRKIITSVVVIEADSVKNIREKQKRSVAVLYIGNVVSMKSVFVLPDLYKFETEHTHKRTLSLDKSKSTLI